jgi:hypothetical protein
MAELGLMGQLAPQQSRRAQVGSGSKAADQRRLVSGRYIRSTPVSRPTGPVLGGS